MKDDFSDVGAMLFWLFTKLMRKGELIMRGNTVTHVEQFLSKYVTFAEDYHKLPLALWVIGTHTWPTFQDGFPYLVITAYVKRAGKTRLMELLAMLSANGRTYSPDSPSSMFRDLQNVKPCMFIDEAEKLNKEDHPAREFLNKGYKAGQTITRTFNNVVVNMECFCPKCFVLIGDVYDTLRDRAMVIVMRRRSPLEVVNEVKYRSAVVKPEAEALREEISQAVQKYQPEIESEYLSGPPLDFLNDRDEEIWSALFAVARVFCPDRIPELTRAAVDMATEKTIERRNYKELLKTEEAKADNNEARILLLRDMLQVMHGHKHMASLELLEHLKAIHTSPWRKFRGEGLTVHDMAALLDALGVKVTHVRVGNPKHNHGKAQGTVRKGYKFADLVAAAEQSGLEVTR